jgi:hypothetical protein
MEKSHKPTSHQGCQIFLCKKYQNGENIPNYHELYQMSIKYNKRPYNGQRVNRICHHLPLQDPPKFTQIWIFGLKTNHLATLLPIQEIGEKIQEKKMIWKILAKLCENQNATFTILRGGPFRKGQLLNFVSLMT